MIKVTYIDHMGSDLTVVNSARVSFGKKSELVEGAVKQSISSYVGTRLVAAMWMMSLSSTNLKNGVGVVLIRSRVHLIKELK